MLSCTSTSLDLIFHLGFFNNWSLATFRRSRFCHTEERSIIKPGNKQDNGTSVVHNKFVTKDDLPISHSPIAQQDSPPPLVSALKASADQSVASFHFPGHNRGRAAPSSLTQLIGLRPFVHDFSALPELGILFSPEGPILDAQRQAAKLFGSSETWFLVGGTTCGIQAAIMATCSPGEFLILPRNSHISAISAMVLSGAQPKYIIPQYDFDWDIAGGATSSQVEQAIKELEMEGRKAAAVFITSPTYHGICSNLAEISKLCHSHGIPLIVDEAHGAHLGFHPQLPNSALQQGADLAVQSTHKVLCSLTQSSMLHMLGNIVDSKRIGRCLQTLQSTSPSFLLLGSLDAARAQLSENPDTIFNKAMGLAFEAKHLIKEIPGISVFDLLGFHPQLPNSALQQGADLAVQSTHKVLCSLTQSSMLHMLGNIVDSKRIGRCLQTLQSTSPSFLLLGSLDAARAQLSENPDTIFNKAMGLAFEAKHLIKEIPGISVFDLASFSDFTAIDPLRLTIGFWQLGLSGYEADEILCRDHGINCELVGTQSLTFVINLGTSRQHIQRLVSGIKHLTGTHAPIHGGKGRLQHSVCTPFADIKMSMIPRDAFFASKKKVSIAECLGEVCGEFICPFPPGIPVLIAGEIVTEKALDYLLDVRNEGAVITGASDPLLTSMVVCNV